MRKRKETLNVQRPTSNIQLRAHAAVVILAVARQGTLASPLFSSDLSVGRWALGVGHLTPASS